MPLLGHFADAIMGAEERARTLSLGRGPTCAAAKKITRMEEQKLMLSLTGSAMRIAALALIALCWSLPGSKAASPGEIDASVRATLEQFHRQVRSSRELTRKAAGILVFPTVVKAGFGFGGEYGEGALLSRGRPRGYYNTVSASFGFQFGAQAKSVIIMFMTPEALDSFYRTDGWKVGVDGSVAVVTVGAGGAIDTNTIRSPIVAFIFDQKGLMYNLTLEGSKISRIYR
jgi:lipid-binding SYLF domain-containing protein